MDRDDGATGVLRLAMKTIGMTQERVAGVLGMTQSNVSKLARGDSLRLRELATIAGSAGASIRMSIVTRDGREVDLSREVARMDRSVRSVPRDDAALAASFLSESYARDPQIGAVSTRRVADGATVVAVTVADPITAARMPATVYGVAVVPEVAGAGRV